MAKTRTRKKTLLKLGPLEVSRRVPVVPRPPKPPAPVVLATKPRPRPAVGKEIGVSGNGPGLYGFGDSGEYVRALQGANGRAIYDEMRRSDPQVRSILQAIKLPIRQANYYIEPPSDASEDVAIAEEAEGDFFRGMSLTWDDTVRHALLMLDFGFSVLEKVWEFRDEKIRLRKLDPRLPQSIVDWRWDREKRRLLGPLQHDENGTPILLPIEKLLVFSSEREGDGWEGLSLLRPLYKPWYIKGKLEKINAIKHDRHGVGIPKAHEPQGATPEDRDDMVETLENIQAQEQAYLIEPEGWEVGLLGGGEKAGTDALPSIRYYDEVMSRAALTMFTMLGQTESGSRALGESFTDIFRLSLQAYADYLCEVFNRFVLREYIDYNWHVTEYPLLKVRRIQQLPPQTLQLLAAARLITPDFELENAIRRELNLPERKEKEQEPPAPPEAKKDEAPEEKEPSEEDMEEPPEEEAEEHAEHPRGLAYADRPLREEELLCDLAGIEMRLNTDTAVLASELLKLKEAQVKRVAELLVAGRRVQDIAVPAKKEMHESLLRAYRRQFRSGKSEASEEMQRQIPGRKLAEVSTEAPEIEELSRLVEEELSIKVEGVADKLKAQLATEALNLKKAGLRGDALLAGLLAWAQQRISDAGWTALASSAVNQGWGAGREAAMRAAAAGIQDIYRSGILDAALCGVCRPKDGVHHALGDPAYMAPDPLCEGGPGQCRCINIAIMKAESAPETPRAEGE